MGTFTDTAILVYQAFNPQIADYVVREQKYVAAIASCFQAVLQLHANPFCFFISFQLLTYWPSFISFYFFLSADLMAHLAIQIVA